MGERRITDGGRLLRRHIDRLGIGVPEWCARFGIDRIKVQRALNGERWQRITVDFAHDVSRATSGEVQWHHWLSSTAVPGRSGGTTKAA